MVGDNLCCLLRSVGLGSIRNLFVVMAVVMSFVLLLWVHMEQSDVARCNEVISGRSLDQPAAAPVHVVVQMPAQNLTSATQNQQFSGHKWDFDWDRRAWSDREDAIGVPMRTIVLVRHGQYDFSTGILNDRGRQQANITGARLRQLGMSYDLILHSDMDRARETAHIIQAHLPQLALHEDPLLAEGGPVPPEPPLNYWSLPDAAYFTDGPRIEAAFRRYFYRADKLQQRETVDILVGHSNIFRYFLLRALQFPENGWMRVFIAHASISLIHINPDGTVTVTKFGDSGHFTPEMITF